MSALTFTCPTCQTQLVADPAQGAVQCPTCGAHFTLALPASPAPPAPAPAPPEVEALLRAGKTIEAIKRYREATGVSLKEAKDAVEALRAGLPPAPSHAAPAPAPAPPEPDTRSSLQKWDDRNGCVWRVPLALGAFVLTLVLGLGFYVRTTDAGQCALRQVTQHPAVVQTVGEPATAGLLTLAPSVSWSAGAFEDRWESVFLTTVHGPEGWGVVWVGARRFDRTYLYRADFYPDPTGRELTGWQTMPCP